MVANHTLPTDEGDGVESGEEESLLFKKELDIDHLDVDDDDDDEEEEEKNKTKTESFFTNARSFFTKVSCGKFDILKNKLGKNWEKTGKN